MNFQFCSPIHNVDESLLASELDAAAQERFNKAKKVIDTNCTSCHKAGGSASNFPLDLPNENFFVNMGVVVPGNPDQSRLIYRLKNYTGTTPGQRNMPPEGRISDDDFNDLFDWVKRIGEKQTEFKYFTCNDDGKTSATKSLMLSKQQLSNALEDLFGSSVVASVSGELSAVPLEVSDANTNVRLSLVDDSFISAYFNLAFGIAAAIVSDTTDRNKVFSSCASGSNPNNSCIDFYLSNVANKIFRRPLTSEELTFARGLANQGGDYRENIKALLAYHLQSPQFLWRIELGDDSNLNHTMGRTYLTQYEIASRLAFDTINSIPDDALLRAASEGKLASAEQIKLQVRRLLNTDRGKTKITEMMAWWVKANRIKNINNLPADLKSGLNLNGLESAMYDETIKYTEESIYTDQASFIDLITSKKSYASHTGLAAVYGHEPVSQGQSAEFGGRRQGLLMRAGFFTSDSPRSGIISRGVAFQERFLCNKIPSPNVDIMGDRDQEELTPEELLNTTNRAAVAHQTKSPVCMTCHSVINPTGFAFENFDSFGRIRNQEIIFDMNNNLHGTLPVDTSGDVPISPVENVSVQDGYDLITGMANSGSAAACMTRTAFRYVNEKNESLDDECELERVFNIFNNPTRSVVDGLVELIAHDHIAEKVH